MKKNLRIVSDILLAVLVFCAWGWMFHGENGILVSRGFSSLKYFTILSNLFVGFVALIDLIRLCKGSGDRKWIYLLKYISTVSVLLTLSTVLFFLGHIYGYRAMFAGVNFILHLLVPVLAAMDFIFLQLSYKITLKESAAAILPMAVYGIGYFLNILIHGVTTGHGTNDWYGFARWGLAWTPAVFLIIALITWGLGQLLLLLRNVNTPRKGDPHGASTL